jgi:hypothetical protein
MIIAVDFDGTCVTHEYPKVGKNIGAGPVLRRLVKSGHKIILFSMRNDLNGDLKDALDWFKNENIPLYGINENPSQTWSTSPKAYAHVYIDDAALGCPVIKDYNLSDRNFVSWTEVSEVLDELECFNNITGDEWKIMNNEILKELNYD